MNDQYLGFKNRSFDEGVEFIFNYLSDEELQNKWYAVEGIATRFGDNFAQNFTKIFNNPESLLDKFTLEQINQGFIFILGPKVLIRMWLWNKNNNPELRQEFIFSMVNVFEKIFAKYPIQNACFMWWDYLRGFNDDKDLKVMNWMFQALAKIIKIDSVECQMSALHGLGHIEHFGKQKLIEKFLKQHPNFPLKDYALAAIEENIP